MSNFINSMLSKLNQLKTMDDHHEKVKLQRPKHVLLNVYGVTTSWNAFKERLIPFIRRNLKQYIDNHFYDARLKKIIANIRERCEYDSAEGFQIPLIHRESESVSEDQIKKQIVTNILWQIDNQHPYCINTLNILFNLIWAEASDNGTLLNHVFDDVPRAFQRWKKEESIKLFSYASGCCDGQKIFFKSTIAGDLSSYFKGHIDSSTYKKKYMTMFENIYLKVNDYPENIVFFTDNLKEAEAALDSCINTVVVLREGNPKLTNEELQHYTCIKSFDDIEFFEDPSNPAP